MIGQYRLRDILGYRISHNELSPLSIIVGSQGSGKKTLVRELLSSNPHCVIADDCKVDTVRSIIDMAYEIPDGIYVFFDVDSMSLEAKNSLLKVTEESPNNSKFIITAVNYETLLSTIKSRGMLYTMDAYTKSQISEYVTEMNGSQADLEIAINICDNLGEVHDLLACGSSALNDFVGMVIDNLNEVSEANAFKIGDRIALKTDGSKFDLKLFWRAVSRTLLDRIISQSSSNEAVKPYYSEWIMCTSYFLNQLHISNINKQLLFDNWIIAMKGISDGQ